MKTLINFYHRLGLLVITSCLWLLQSCIIYQQAPPPREPMVKVSDIIQMSKNGATSKVIISKIKASHTAYTLKADQLAKLSKQGVADSVINFMEQTHINSVLRNMSNGNYYNYGGLGFGGYYGYPFYGYPFSYGGYWGPTFIYGGGARFGGHGGGRYR